MSIIQKESTRTHRRIGTYLLARPVRAPSYGSAQLGQASRLPSPIVYPWLEERRGPKKKPRCNLSYLRLAAIAHGLKRQRTEDAARRNPFFLLAVNKWILVHILAAVCRNSGLRSIGKRYLGRQISPIHVPAGRQRRAGNKPITTTHLAEASGVTWHRFIVHSMHSIFESRRLAVQQANCALTENSYLEEATRPNYELAVLHSAARGNKVSPNDFKLN